MVIPTSDQLESHASKLSIQQEHIDLKVKSTCSNGARHRPLPDRKLVEDLLKRRFFIAPAFEIYGGVSGLFDFGPIGCSTKANFLNEWRNHFIIHDNMLELETSVLTPENVLKASGHVDKFSDFMTRDLITGECFRVDHLLKEKLPTVKMDAALLESTLAKLDNMSLQEVTDLMRHYHIKSPNGNDLDDPNEFNLMFSTTLGATGLQKCFLRPETAQGIFVNFPRLLAFNQGRLPFAAAQIGQAFRNEIAPRAGLLRVREFCMAEIEHFVDPNQKSHHPSFKKFENVRVSLLSAADQLAGMLDSAEPVTIGQAVVSGVVNNQHLGYFMARIQLFLTKVGVAADKLRFRQHLPNEMAHYACDCWDAECQTTYGWIECVGCADRSCFDLKQHSRETGAAVTAERAVETPRTVKRVLVKPNRRAIGTKYKQRASAIITRLGTLSDNDARIVADAQERGEETYELKLSDGSTLQLPFETAIITRETVTVNYETFIPSVIEPSFGVGRVLYAIWEHCFRVREADAQRTYLSLPAAVAPFKCAVLPLSGDHRLMETCEAVSWMLKSSFISHKVERSTSASVGKRYARTDEMGVPFCVTVDFDSINIQPCSVTLRERDSMAQLRVELQQLAKLISDLCNGLATWDSAVREHGTFTEQKTG